MVHDLDFPVYKRSTCLKRAFWLVALGVFGNREWLIKHMPIWLAHEKYAFALALAEVDKLYGVKAVFGLTKEVQKVFPDLRKQLEEKGFETRDHSHIKKKTFGRGVWFPPLQVKPENMIYDRLYTLRGHTTLPARDDVVAWHVDHPFNLDRYLEFLERAKQGGLL